MSWLGAIGRITGHSRLTGPLAELRGAVAYVWL